MQPLLIFVYLSAAYFNLVEHLIHRPLLLTTSFIPVIAVILYLRAINSAGSSILKFPTLVMFQAFLQAWSSEDPSALEEFIEMSSSKTTVQTSLIEFKNETKTVIIIPEIHPGPFYPIGSSNLPYQIFSYFSNRGYLPLVLHGVSGHEYNLTSKREVYNLISSYDHLKSLKGGNTCTRPITVKSGKVVASGIAFGNYASIFLTLAPHGMEDFPREIKKPLEEISRRSGFEHLLLVDTHNSQGSQADQEEISNIINATTIILKKLRKAEQYSFKAGFAHSSKFDITFDGDVGPAGIGTCVLEIDENKYILIVVDANNVTRGLREEIINSLKSSKVSVFELCTSDTHITAGKVMTKHGYIALGDKTKTNYLIKVIKKLVKEAICNLSESSFNIKYKDTKVKVVGYSFLDDISQALDKVIKIARRGGILLVILIIIIILITVIFN